MKAILLQLLPELVPVVLAVLGAVGSIVGVHIAQLIAAAKKHTKLASVLEALDTLVTSVVTDVFTAEKQKLLAISGAKTLEPADLDELKKIAMLRVKQDLSTQGWATLQQVFSAVLGVSSVENLVKGKVTAAAAKVQS